ncbi:MAG TPA: heavy-metal-associated domain-containing protein [Candidatus Saccharimonadales bacterium]|jgi:copper chaperone CopZ|nr:heavy-metal-associated domain-containing protein [Candidatus Saccharimonadales bacterium]
MKIMRPLALVTTTLILTLASWAKDVSKDIKISGMTCGACGVTVRKSLEKTKGVKHVDVSTEKGLATIVYDDSKVTEQQLREAINKTGFKAEAP